MADETNFALSNEHVQALMDVEPRIRQLRALIARAKRAGLDVTLHEAELDKADRLRRGLLTEFGPAVTSRQ